MKRKIFIMFITCLLLTSFFHLASADHDDEDDYERRESKYLAPVNNDTFKQECGVCHFAYQPGLLPSGSWEKILSNLPSHFGEEVSRHTEIDNNLVRLMPVLSVRK